MLTTARHARARTLASSSFNAATTTDARTLPRCLLVQAYDTGPPLLDLAFPQFLRQRIDDLLLADISPFGVTR